MQTNIRNFCLTFVAGLIAGLAVSHVAQRDSEPPSARVAINDADGANGMPRPAANAAPRVERDATRAADTPDAMVAADRATTTKQPRGAEPARDVVATQQPPIPRAVLSDDIDARPTPLTGLLDASSLRCDIDVAHGANWLQGKATLHAISYQGGPFSLDSIDLDAQTAMMSGGSGVTGSLTGELEMRTTAGNKGLTFSAFTRHGDLLLVTVYAALDSKGRYRTVMTTFGDQFDHETAQFFGACDVSLPHH